MSSNKRVFATAKGTSCWFDNYSGMPRGGNSACLGGRSLAPLQSLSNNFRWSNGVKELVYACPDVLHEPDPVSKLLPFMMAH
jgi:hypothetical protein